MSKTKKITFQDGDGPFLTIKSEWKSKIITTSSNCQTEEVKYENSQFQTGLIIPNARSRIIKIKQLIKSKKGSKKAEGKEEPPKMISKKLIIPSLDSIKNGLTPSDDDIYNSLPIDDDTQTEETALEYANDAFDLEWKLDEKTSAFFIRASKLILDELDVSKSMDIFQNQVSLVSDNLDAPVIKEKIDYTYLSRESMEHEHKIKLECIDVQYNCNNYYLWAAYGMSNHLSWCEHQGGIVCWKVKNLLQPFTIIECDACVTCIKCHPQNPSIIAAGTFDGKVHIWNISYTEQPNIGNTPVGDPFHKESIISIDWIYDSSTIYHILSGSTDGLVLCWNLRDDVKYPFLGFYIPFKKNLKEPAALTSVSCTHEGMMTTSFIATSNSGVIYQGRLRDDRIPPVTKFEWEKRALDLIKRCQGTQKVIAHIESFAQKKKLKEIKLEHLFKCKLSPYVLYARTSVLNVEPHSSPLFSLKTSPLISNLVCCTMMDGCIQSKKLVDLYPPFQVFKCVNFSPHKSSVFAAGSTDGTVLIYDLITSKNGPKFTVSCSSSFAVNNVSFSGKDLNQLAAASGDGVVFIYNLPLYLKETKNDELIEMKKITQGKGYL